jgi:hypothetical protein
MIEMLVNAIEEMSDGPGQGRGPPEHGQKARERAQQLREQTPVVKPEEEIQPPWEREDYDNKQDWLAERDQS